MIQPTRKRNLALQKELAAAARAEQKLAQQAMRARPAAWKTDLKQKIPAKVTAGLESAFARGFSLIFRHGLPILEKSYSKETLQADHSILDYAFQLKGSRRELKKLRKNARQSEFRNMAVTALEGIGLGALGIGMPDIVLFLGAILRGVYETALHYGYGYESPEEQMRILLMMETSLSTGDDWARGNAAVDLRMQSELPVSTEDLDAQIRHTAAVFADDLLLLKFIQGLPLVGILGGSANPVYYGKVLRYVQLKYRQRYLLDQQSRS